MGGPERASSRSVRLRSPSWTSFELTAMSIRSGRFRLFWRFRRLGAEGVVCAPPGVGFEARVWSSLLGRSLLRGPETRGKDAASLWPKGAGLGRTHNTKVFSLIETDSMLRFGKSQALTALLSKEAACHPGGFISRRSFSNAAPASALFRGRHGDQKVARCRARRSGRSSWSG